MDIQIDNDIVSKCGLDEAEILELFAIALYKKKGVHGALAGKLVGMSELEFHSLLSKRGENVNYDASDLVSDIKNNDL